MDGVDINFFYLKQISSDDYHLRDIFCILCSKIITENIIIIAHYFIRSMFRVTNTQNQPDLETALTEIASLIEQMEQGELSLEQSLSQFERGVTLIKHAQKILQEAEQKVQILMQNNNQEELGHYENKEE